MFKVHNMQHTEEVRQNIEISAFDFASMKLDPSMSDSDLRRIFGLQVFVEGKLIVEEGLVSPPEEVHPSIHIQSVHCRDGSSHTVLIRDYADGNTLYDCDCGSDKCCHIVAILLSEDDESVADGSEEDLIERIDSMIDSVTYDIVSDPDYDDDANYYEDWEINKYGLENYNDDIEYEHVNGILTKILCDIGDPDQSMMLMDKLMRCLSSLEFDNGGADRAFSEHKSDIASLFERISLETLAKIMGNTTFNAKLVYGPHIDNISQKRLDEAYALLDEESRLCDRALEMQFEKGDYDAYIRCSFRKLDAIIRVVEHLDSINDDSVSGYAGMLAGCDAGSREKTVADILSVHGYRSEAAKLYLKMFWSSHKYEYLQSYRANADDGESSKIVDDLASMTFSKDHYDVQALSTLVLDGRGADVERYICRVGFVPRRSYRDYDCSGILGLCRLLYSKGFIESAAVLGRGLILLRLDVKDANSYQDAVDMLKYMDGESGFEGAAVPHSVFRTSLKTEYPKVRKFWGLYDGTWVDKTQRRSFHWYWE